MPFLHSAHGLSCGRGRRRPQRLRNAPIAPALGYHAPTVSMVDASKGHDPSVRPHDPHPGRGPIPPGRLDLRGKVDGWRILAYKDGSRVRLMSRTGVEHSKRFRGVAEAIAALPFDTLVLDGEVAIFDHKLRSRFDWLRATPDELATPPMYIAFDVLYRAGKDMTESWLQDRRVLLEDALAGGSSYVLPVPPRRQRAGRLGSGAGQRLRGLRREG